MGCINTKSDINDINSNKFRVSNIDSEGTVLWSGQLEISRTELKLYRKGKRPTQWPLQCLRRYGYDADLFSFEAGRRCDTGPGIYAFRCRRAETLFHMLQSYIQGRAYSTDENISSNDTTASTHINTNLTSSIMTHRNATTILHNQQMQQNSANLTAIRSGNDTLQHSTNRSTSGVGIGTSQSLSPNGTIHSTSNQSRSSDTLTSDGNYLEPNPTILRQQMPINTRFTTGVRLSSVSSGPISPDIQSPGSPNSITNILEVTQLNPLPTQSSMHHGVSNLYQEFPINNNNHSNLTVCKKLSLDIPPQEPAPMRLTAQQNISSIIPMQSNKIDEMKNNMTSNVTTKTDSPVKFISIPSNPSSLSQLIPTSPNYDPTHSYMNINLGDVINKSSQKGQDSPHIMVSTPTTSKMFGFVSQTMYSNNINSSILPTIDATRCYENLEPSDMRQLIYKNQHHHPRYSKPDIFSKVDLPLNQSSLDKSEPCTPTINIQMSTGGIGGAGIPSSSSTNNSVSTCESKVNYITLDLNEVPNLAKNLAINSINSIYNNNSNIGVINLSSCISDSGGLIKVSGNSNIGGGIGNDNRQNSLLPPESPKNTSLGYVTIDFNKTVALSNSTTPSSELDSEGSRMTRHSSTAVPSSRHSNSVSSE